jgi:hypothetical protein
LNLYSKNLGVAFFFATAALAVALSSLQSPAAGAHQHKADAPSSSSTATPLRAASTSVAPATAPPATQSAIAPGAPDLRGVHDPESPFGEVAAVPANPRSAAQFARAMREFKAGRRTAAFGMFTRLADDGDAEAARVALLMVRYGDALYGAGWGASQEQIDYWLAISRKPMPRFLAESGD